MCSVVFKYRGDAGFWDGFQMGGIWANRENWPDNMDLFINPACCAILSEMAEKRRYHLALEERSMEANGAVMFKATLTRKV